MTSRGICSRRMRCFVLPTIRETERSFPPRLTRIAISLGLAAVASTTPAVAQFDTLEVDSDQRVTVIGRAPSLKTVIEDLCWRAGVRVDFYDAEDRSFGGTFRGLPLDQFLTRVLSRESFMTGGTSGEGRRLVWLRVLGDPVVGAKRRASGGTRAGVRAALDVPPTLARAAFTAGEGKEHEEQRREALNALSARIAGDSRQLGTFLATDAKLIAETLAQYPGAKVALAELAERYPDPRIRTKLAEIETALGGSNRP